MATRDEEDRRKEMAEAFHEDPSREASGEPPEDAKPGSREELGHDPRKESVDGTRVERTTAGLPEDRPQVQMAEPDESKRRG
ncbi:MAG: hypothetical protein WBV82_06215 [Myxococcaceae bacterium]